MLSKVLKFSRCLIFEVCMNLKTKNPKANYGGIAQLGEHLLCKQGVIGSIPIISTKGEWTRTKRRPWACERDMGLQLSWLERPPDKREVDGSSPFKPTIFEVILRQLRLRVPLYALHLLPCLTTKTILL